jgi:hypothetical protein
MAHETKKSAGDRSNIKVRVVGREIRLTARHLIANGTQAADRSSDADSDREKVPDREEATEPFWTSSNQAQTVVFGNGKPFSAERRRRAVAVQVGATGFEPATSRSRTRRAMDTDVVVGEEPMEPVVLDLGHVAAQTIPARVDRTGRSEARFGRPSSFPRQRVPSVRLGGPGHPVRRDETGHRHQPATNLRVMPPLPEETSGLDRPIGPARPGRVTKSSPRLCGRKGKPTTQVGTASQAGLADARPGDDTASDGILSNRNHSGRSDRSAQRQLRLSCLVEAVVSVLSLNIWH